MHPPNHRPTEMYLGTSDERRDLLRQEARNRRPLVALYTMLAVVLVIVGVLTTVVVGPGEATSWVVTYLIPTLVILGVMVGAGSLLIWGVIKLYEWGHKIY